jgi:uncharacterized membrane protein YhaH (DUF805 family)
MKYFFITIYDAFYEALERSFDFKGRTSRSSYFPFVIPVTLLCLITFAYPFYYGMSSLFRIDLGFIIFFGLFSNTNFLLTCSSFLFVLLIILFTVPMLSILSRRLNDCGLSGFYLIPLVIILFPLSLFNVIVTSILLVIYTILSLLPSV